MDWFLYDNNLRHERVKWHSGLNTVHHASDPTFKTIEAFINNLEKKHFPFTGWTFEKESLMKNLHPSVYP